jgi:hypothetical protein
MEFDADGNPIVTTPATGTATTPAPAATPPANTPLTLENVDVNDPAQTAAFIKRLQHESKDHRLKSRDWREKAEAAETELAKLRTEKAEADRVKLEEEKRFKELYEQEKAQKQEVALAAQKVAIDAKIENVFLAKGIHPKFMKLMDRNGISIDASGNVAGVDKAFDKLMAEYEDVLTPAAKAKEGEAGTEEPPAGKTSPTAVKMVPGTNMTYDQYNAQRFNAAKPPAPGATKTAPSKPDWDKMTKQQQDDWFKQYKQGLARK